MGYRDPSLRRPHWDGRKYQEDLVRWEAAAQEQYGVGFYELPTALQYEISHGVAIAVPRVGRRFRNLVSWAKWLGWRDHRAHDVKQKEQVRLMKVALRLRKLRAKRKPAQPILRKRPDEDWSNEEW